MRYVRGVYSKSLEIVRKYFPKVRRVVDAVEPVLIQVQPRDVARSKTKDHRRCALSVAGKRTLGAEGMLASVRVLYAIKGRTATRYHLPPSVSREMTAFDRGGEFAVGLYQLIIPDRPLGTDGHKERHGKRPLKRARTSLRHVTHNIRSVLK